jgi:GDPmannose 4,6-dehydratase
VSKKIALITGVTGQVGSYLAEYLLEKDYEVHGVIRKSSTFSTERIEHIRDRLHLHYGDLSDGLGLAYLIFHVMPDEIYNLAAQSHVQVSFELPMMTAEHTALGVVPLLEAIHRSNPRIKFYQASSSELFGNAPAPQNELTPLQPRSPYAAAKAYAYWMTKIYREAYGMFAVNGILFNTESPRRSPTFVTRKITQAIARIKAGKQKKLELGNLDAKRDWGYAGDYVKGIYKMMQHEVPDDWALATGESHSVQEWLDTAVAHAYAIDTDNALLRDAWLNDWCVEHLDYGSRSYNRPLEVNHLQGDANKAKFFLGWQPEVKFADLVKLMMDEDLAREQ